MAQRAEMIAVERSLTNCLSAHFLLGSHIKNSGTISPFQLCWIKAVCMLRCNMPHALLAEWPGSFMCHCGNTGAEQRPNKCQHTKLPPLLPGFKLATVWPWVQHSYKQAILTQPHVLWVWMTCTIKQGPSQTYNHFHIHVHMNDLHCKTWSR